MKRYQLHYHTNLEKSNTISISWEQGLQNIKAYYNKELFYESKTMSPLNQGETIYHEKLGNVFIRFCSRPIGFEVKIGDLYLENSRILAQEALGSISAIWIFIGVISTLSTLGFMFLPGIYFDNLLMIIAGLMWSFSIFYIVAGILIRKGKIWAYYTSLGIFAAMTILYLIAFEYGNIPILIVRIITIIVVLRNFKSMRDLYRHYKAKKSKSALSKQGELLDV